MGKGALDTRSADGLDAAAVMNATENATHIYHCMNVPYQDWARVLSPLQASLVAAARAHGAVLAVADNLYAYARGVPVISETTAEVPPTRKGLLGSRCWITAERPGEKCGAEMGGGSSF